MDSASMLKADAFSHACQPISHSLGGPSPPAQWTSPETLLRNEGQAKQTKKPTSPFTTGQSTLSFLIRPIAFALATPLSSPMTAFGIFLGFCAGKTFTKNFVSDGNPILRDRVSIKI